jgi:plasmid stabilization system protein ParE
MADKLLPKIIYSKRSLANVRTIRDYLLYKFTQKEVDDLYNMLGDFERVVVPFPELYPLIANSKKMRRAVLSKQLSVFYTHLNHTISIAAIFDNRMDNAKWPK